MSESAEDFGIPPQTPQEAATRQIKLLRQIRDIILVFAVVIASLFTISLMFRADAPSGPTAQAEKFVQGADGVWREQ